MPLSHPLNPYPTAHLSAAILQRPPSAYNLFVKDHKLQIKEELGVGAAGCDIMLRLSGGWVGGRVGHDGAALLLLFGL
jgi:hypothetical protein